MSQLVVSTPSLRPVHHRLYSRTLLPFIVCIGLLFIVSGTSANPPPEVKAFLEVLNTVSDDDPHLFDDQLYHTLTKAFPGQEIPSRNNSDFKSKIIEFINTFDGDVDLNRLQAATKHIDIYQTRDSQQHDEEGYKSLSQRIDELLYQIPASSTSTSSAGSEPIPDGNSDTDKEPTSLEYVPVQRPPETLKCLKSSWRITDTRYPLEAALHTINMLSHNSLLEIQQNDTEDNVFHLLQTLDTPWNDETASELEWELIPRPKKPQSWVYSLLNKALDSYSPEAFNWVDKNNVDHNLMVVDSSRYSGDLQEYINEQKPKVNFATFKNLIVAIDDYGDSLSYPQNTIIEVKLHGFYGDSEKDVKMKPVAVVFDRSMVLDKNKTVVEVPGDADHSTSNDDNFAYTVLSGSSLTDDIIQKLFDRGIICLMVLEIISDSDSGDESAAATVPENLIDLN